MASPKQLLAEVTANGKHICIGLDSDTALIPKFLRAQPAPVLTFNKAIIDATMHIAAAYKLNFAFYEQYGIAGMEALLQTIDYIGDRAFIIGDAKRGDIGNTSAAYAKAVFGAFKCHAVTVHPYMGYDSVAPFLSYPEHITYLLTLTSNSGSNDFEKQQLASGNQLFTEVIRKAGEWNTQGNVGLVFGATNPAELEQFASSLRPFPLLIPGIGSQGGDAARTVAALAANGITNYLINSSRAIIYASTGTDFAQAAANAAAHLQAEITALP